VLEDDQRDEEAENLKEVAEVADVATTEALEEPTEAQGLEDARRGGAVVSVEGTGHEIDVARGRVWKRCRETDAKCRRCEGDRANEANRTDDCKCSAYRQFPRQDCSPGRQG
jgi:hypothetical protein